jgi:chorismate mutase
MEQDALILTSRNPNSFAEAGREREAVMVYTADPVSKLRDLRDSIDNIDAAIVHMLAERFRCTRTVGKLKARHGLPSRDPGREAEQVSRLRHLAGVSKLDPDFVEKFLAIVIHEVIRHHESVRRATTEGIFRDELR